MNALLKIATITNLVAEIGDCDEVQILLDGFVKTLIEARDALGYEDRSIIILNKEDLENHLGEAYREGKKVALEEVEKLPNEFFGEVFGWKDGEPLVADNCDICKTKPAGAMSLTKDGQDLEFCEDCMVEYDKQNEDEEEDDDSVEPCKCKADWDIRCLCDPVRSAKQFSRCPQRFIMTYECIKNDFEKYKDIEASCSRGEKQEKIYAYARAEPFFLDDDNLEDELLYIIEQDEEHEEENCCVNCDGFIPYADESSAKWCDSEERWVCYSCKDDCFCAECEEYFPDEDDLEYLNKSNDNCDKYCCDCITPKKCEDLEQEVIDYLGEMDDNQDKLDMLEKIKNIIAEYKK